MNKQERLELVNQVIAEIAKCGRGFFGHKDRIARLEIDKRGRIWFVDDYTQKRIYTHYRGRWNYHFSYGYSTQQLIRQFAEFVQTGKPNLSIHWLGYGRISWGYPSDDLPPIWELAKPAFSPVALQELEEVLSQLQEVA